MNSSLVATQSLTGVPMHYCPGCEHGLLTRLVAATLDAMELRTRAVMVDSVGCSVLAYRYLNIDHIQAPHGRAPAVMTGLKRYRPDLLVFTVQGDGDALAIGLSELLQTANRGEAVTVFVVNNATYGMTGGQMAPTTLLGQVTTTTPKGRDVRDTGRPLDGAKLLAMIEGAAYVRRASLVPRPRVGKDGPSFRREDLEDARRAVENAFKVQLRGGFAYVEFLSTCWVNWRMSIQEAKRFASTEMVRQFPLGVYRDVFGVERM